jgi:hypothetical protein
VQPTSVPLYNFRPGALVFHLLLPIIMFPKALLTSLVIGVLSANALSVPLARSPAHEASKDLKNQPGLETREPHWRPSPEDYVDTATLLATPQSKREPSHGSPSVLDYLLATGAINPSNSKREPGHGSSSVLDYLLATGAIDSSQSKREPSHGSSNVLDYLLATGAIDSPQSKREPGIRLPHSSPFRREPAPEPNSPFDYWGNGYVDLPGRRDLSPEELVAHFARDVDPDLTCEFPRSDLIAT